MVCYQSVEWIGGGADWFVGWTAGPEIPSLDFTHDDREYTGGEREHERGSERECTLIGRTGEALHWWRLVLMFYMGHVYKRTAFGGCRKCLNIPHLVHGESRLQCPISSERVMECINERFRKDDPHHRDDESAIRHNVPLTKIIEGAWQQTVTLCNVLN
jgi:hypothetical protein